MHGLRMLTIVNNDPGDGEGTDYVNSWNPANYADQQYLNADEWGCGIQPWSRGNPDARKPITAAEWEALQWYSSSSRHTDNGCRVSRRSKLWNIVKRMQGYALTLGLRMATMLSNSTESKR